MWLSSLFQSMPSIEEDTKLTSLEADGNYNNLSASFGNEKVSISALLKVLCCKDAKMTNNALPHTDLISQEALREVCVKAKG